jgi:protein disulfide-isomerase
MEIEIWSDIACPFCYIGKVRLEKALSELSDVKPSITWRSFQLDPSAPENPEHDIYDTLAKKYGKDRKWAIEMNSNVVEMAEGEGLNFDMDAIQPVNTFKAHRLLHFAAKNGKQHEIKEALLNAYFTEGKDVGNIDTLTGLANDVGLDKTKTKEFLANNHFSEKVNRDMQKAREMGIQGVPFFLINKKYGLSGAQPMEAFKEALQKILNEENS